MVDEPSILQRIASGEAAGLDACIDTYGPAIWAIARRRLSDAHDAEEAVQDVFAAIWDSANRFDPHKGSEKTFVLTVARRRIIDRARRRAPPVSEILDDPAASSDQTRAIETQDEVAAVGEALSALKPIQREILRLSIHEGLSHSQVSEQLDLPLGTVKTHLRRGLQRVRQLLGVSSPAKEE